MSNKYLPKNNFLTQITNKRQSFKLQIHKQSFKFKISFTNTKF